MAAGIDLVGLTKRFHHGHAAAVDDIDLSVAGGEFFSLLGPSGCGKTTTLRLVAGFEEPTAGRILLDGVDVSGVPPHKRNVNTVFQSYALFPFMSVFDNVAFGLKYAGCSKAELKTRVGGALALVDMASFSSRRPSQLSGGQQQRIALARALVLNPAALLLDEPLGALDAKLRRSLKVELKALQERVGITFIYVTHDQEEALTMSDRLAVMHAGRIAQIGTPREVYEEPTDSYVADFLGAANLIEISVIERTVGSTSTLKLGDSVLTTSGAVPASPGETAQVYHASDIIGEVSVTAYKNWSLNLDYQWNPYTSQTDKSEILVQYRPDPSKVVNIGYRFQQDILKQYDGSFAWPIAGHWNTVGRWVYSLQDRQTIEQLAGFEYKSCCWKIQVLQRRYVTNRTGGLNTSIALQLELTGLSSVGKPADAFLSKEISGYSTRDPDAQ